MRDRILILYQFDSHYNLLSGLMEHLKRNQINADIFNVMTWKLSSMSPPTRRRRQNLSALALKIPKLRGIVLKLFQAQKVLSVVRDYDIIDIHYFSQIYLNLLPRMKQVDKTIKVTFWGSDLYRHDKRLVSMHPVLSKYVDCIQVSTDKMRDDFLKRFPSLAAKIRVGHFGIEKFGIINMLQTSSDINILRHQFKIPEKKIVVACGYNGSSRQQHLEIIQSIKAIPDSMKRLAFFLFPMTYGREKGYLKVVNDVLQDSGLSYSILKKSMTDDEISKIRIISDILINIQKSDAFSASMQEHIYAGNVTIVGDWLPYELFFSNDIFLIKTSIFNLTNTIEDAISNLSFYKTQCKKNKYKLDEMSSWSGSIHDWISIYHEMSTLSQSDIKRLIKHNYLSVN